MEWNELPTPCYVVDENLIEKNLKILQGVSKRTGAKILLAQKAFSMYELYPLIGSYLNGAAASGLYEARLWAEEACKDGLPAQDETSENGQCPQKCRENHLENHIFSPAYREEDFEDILQYCDHIVFNSWKQVRRYAARARAAQKSVGLRINPQCSTQEGHEIYDPCAPGSRLGVTLENFQAGLDYPPERDTINGDIHTKRWITQWKRDDIQWITLLDGLHFHTLCEQDADALEITLDAVEEQFGKWLPHMKWINFGGGHHITRDGYDIPRLERCIRRMQEKYGLTVYLEPGEAAALGAGFLVTSVLETLTNGREIAILDTSAACHMPDVLEMPYRPPLKDSGLPGEKPYTYRLGGPTCLAGDVIGDYSFDHPLKEGERLIFEDMAIYSMVKNNTFNGMPLPAIVLRQRDGRCRIVKEFGYEDFKRRL